MTLLQVLKELESLGSEQTKKTFLAHGAKGELFGVKVGDLKVLQKKIKKNHELALALFDTGNSDAMYLAGMIAEEKKMSKADFNRWAEKATWSMISEYTVAWSAAESSFGWELGLEWIDSASESIASSGWNTLSSWVALKNDSDLDLTALELLLNRIEKTIGQTPDRVRYTMNGFVISVGGYVAALTDKAIATAEQIGTITVDKQGTACKVPFAKEYILKMIEKNGVGKKRKTVKC